MSGGATVVRVNERTNKPIARIHLPHLPTAVAVGNGTMWGMLLDRPNRAWLVRVNTRTNRVTGQTRIPFAATSVAVGAGAVWLGLTGTFPQVLRGNPRTLKLHLLARLL